MRYNTMRHINRHDTYEYVCRECGYCSSDSEAVASTSNGFISRCADCGSRNLSKHHIEEGWDYPEDTVDAVSYLPIKCLRLVDLIPYLPDSEWFTIIKRTGEMNNSITYTYPEKFRVVSIDHRTPNGLAIVVEEL